MSAVAEVAVDASEALVNLSAKSVTFLLSGIIKTAQEIREIAKRTKTNKRQCLRLSERIHIIVDSLQGKQLNDSVGQPMIVALEKFGTFLTKCVDVMDIFANANSMKRLWNNRDYRDQFLDLHTEFSQYATDLSLSIIVTTMLANTNQDQHDRHLDSIHIEQLPIIQAIEYDSSQVKSEQTSLHEFPVQELQTKNIFVSGIWKYRCCLNGTWSELSQVELSFDTKNETLVGFGGDHLGTFRLNGSWSECIQTMNINWNYCDKKLNDEHKQRVHVQWDSDRNIFSGTFIQERKSTSQTDSFSGQFEISLFTSLS